MIKKKHKKSVTILSLFGIHSVSEHGTVLRQLENGLDINVVDSGGRSLLMEAVIRKDHELVRILIRRGADVEIRDKRCWTALHFAAQNSDEVAATLLIDAGADVNAKEYHGNNVIWRAVFDAQDGFDLLKLLLSRGALITEKNDRGISAMDLALSIGDKDLIETLTTK